MPTARIAMIFGGRSVEHEVSVITAHQAMAALPRDRYTPVPVYIAKSGRWYTGEVLNDLANFKNLDALTEQARPVIFSPDTERPGLVYEPTPQRARLFGGRAPEQSLADPIDVAFPLIHGSHGEDGTLQGLFELANLPYVGSGVAASAIGMDKRLTKAVLRDAGLPVLDDILVSRAQWTGDTEATLNAIEARFAYPVFVKPCTLGSSIGVSRANDRMALTDALDVATTYDARAMVEPAQQDIIEVNCAVLGYGDDLKASTCEQPITEGVLSFADKYLPAAGQGGAKGAGAPAVGKQGVNAGATQPAKGGESQGMASARRLIPAPIDPALTQTIQQAAMRVFAALGAAGVARIDFFVRPTTGEYLVNEINTLPGSLAFYLWQHAGVDFPDLLTTLIGYAQTRYREKKRSTYTFASSLLSGQAGGAKRA